MNRISLICIIAFGLFFTACSSSQYLITEAHYRRAETFLQPNLEKLVYHINVHPHWLTDSTGFWHVTQTPEGKRFFLTVLEDQETKPAFDHNVLAQKLSEQTSKELSAADLPFSTIAFEREGKVSFSFGEKRWHYHRNSQELISEPIPSEAPEQGLSPDGKLKAFIRDFNLYVKDVETGEETQLSKDGEYLYEYANTYGWYDLMEGEGGERPENFYVSWSPDSRKIFAYITDLRQAEKMYLLDYSIDTLYRPRLLSYYRGSPGDTTLVYNIPVVFHLDSGRKVKLDMLPIPHFNGVNFRWKESSEGMFGLYPHRGYKQADIIKADAHTGKVAVLASESSDTSVEYGSLIFRRIGEDKMLFSSQRSGWHHLYLHDWHSGAFLNPVTQGEFIVKNVVHVDEGRELIYFLAGGREPGRNPYYDHLYRENWDGSELVLLTPEDAHHQVSVSPCKQYFVDNYSRVDLPTTSVVRELYSGEKIFTISKANIDDLLATGWTPPIPFTAKGRDGQTDIYGIVYPPLDFSTRKKYPIIDYTYTGPHTAITPKSFSSALFNIQNPLRAFGFAVVVVDGMGTAHRSKAFRDVSYRDLGGNMACHVAAIRQLSEQYAWIDITRVGVYGHSAGGYDATRAMLMYPEFYKVGVASAADHDHRMEKAWWPEMYMGYPVEEFYNEQSNITNAHQLEGRLLIAHGGVDENVNPSATFKLAEYLISAGKDFDMLILPSTNHSFGRSDGDYFTKVRWNYFIRHLLPAEPLHNYQFQTILKD